RPYRRKVIAGNLVLRVANHAAAQRPFRADDLLALPCDHHAAGYERTGWSVDLSCGLPRGFPCGRWRRKAGSGSAPAAAPWRRLPFEACFGRGFGRACRPGRAWFGAVRRGGAEYSGARPDAVWDARRIAEGAAVTVRGSRVSFSMSRR